jgi:hypothetical protein
MILRYVDVLGDGLEHETTATVSVGGGVGLPEVVLDGGVYLDYLSWVFLSYRVVEIADDERALFGYWLRLGRFFIGEERLGV